MPLGTPSWFNSVDRKIAFVMAPDCKPAEIFLVILYQKVDDVQPKGILPISMVPPAGVSITLLDEDSPPHVKSHWAFFTNCAFKGMATEMDMAKINNLMIFNMADSIK